MRLYVAGVRYNLWRESNTVQNKTERLCGQIPGILSDAVQLHGKGVIVVIVMQEYGMAGTAVSMAEKNASIAMLASVMKRYPNVILIPGSIAVSEEFLEDTARRKSKVLKIHRNYLTLRHSLCMFGDSQFIKEHNQYSKAAKKGNLAGSIFLQNCAHVITATHKIKHRKSMPFCERERMQQKHRGVFYIGADSPIKSVSVLSHQFDLALLICREHADRTSKVFNLHQAEPLMQVVISDAIGTSIANLFGALNIHMDSVNDLSIFYNMKHSKASLIEEVSGVLYVTNEMRTTKKRIEVDVIKCNVQERTLADDCHLHDGQRQRAHSIDNADIPFSIVKPRSY
tara:strand:+ start:2440 stop:3462 length:1023 start_codon:yes stop_codon:yes gene_type:complete